MKALLLALLITPAFGGTEHAHPAKPPMPVATAHQSQKQAQDQAQDQTQQAAGGSVSAHNGWSLFLAPLAATPQMAPMSGCSPDVTQQAIGVAFGAYSAATSHADPQDCTLMALRNAKVETCQYASAKAIEDLMIAKKLPDYKPSAVQFNDYAPTDCAAIKAPPKPAPVVNYVQAPPVVPMCPKPAKKPARKVVGCRG
jgi:hypothetical protein